jgi:hypothetical protein
MSRSRFHGNKVGPDRREWSLMPLERAFGMLMQDKKQKTIHKDNM